MASRAGRDEFDFVRVIHARGGDATEGGAMNWGINLVRRRRDGLLCVMKTIVPEDTQRRFGHQEAHLLRIFENPHINRFIHVEAAVTADDVGRWHNVQNLYVQHCDAGTLQTLFDRYIEHNQRIPEEFVWHVFRSMADALQAMHFGINRANRREPGPADWNYIVHGDIKPGNIFLHRNAGNMFPTVVLGDFGCCLTRHQLRQMHSQGLQRRPFKFTAAFAAPEANNHTGIFSDVFSLGVSILLLIGAWDGNRIIHPSQLAHLESRRYSPQLCRALRSALQLDFNDRISSKDLVVLVDQSIAAATARGLMVGPDQEVLLPAWALPLAGNPRQPGGGGRRRVLSVPDVQRLPVSSVPMSTPRRGLRANAERPGAPPTLGQTPANVRRQPQTHPRRARPGDAPVILPVDWPQPQSNATQIPRMFVQ